MACEFGSVESPVRVDPAGRRDVQLVAVPQHPERRVHSGDDPVGRLARTTHEIHRILPAVRAVRSCGPETALAVIRERGHLGQAPR